MCAPFTYTIARLPPHLRSMAFKSRMLQDLQEYVPNIRSSSYTILVERVDTMSRL